MHSSRDTSNGTPYFEYRCTIAAVTISSGYEYFGSCTFFSRKTSAILSFTSRVNSGQDSMTFGLPNDVTNEVRTTAPFSYVMSQSHTMWLQSTPPDNAVKDGQNRKNGTSLAR